MGERGLVAVYDEAWSGTPLGLAFAIAGFPLRELVPLWRARLERLAR